LGNVEETTLQSCNGDARWQLSLVEAIQTASPLPAPPDPSVFADAVVMQFTSQGYVPGGTAIGFEPAAPREGNVSTPRFGIDKPVQNLGDRRARSKSPSNVI